MKIILDSKQIGQIISELAGKIAGGIDKKLFDDIVTIGIRSRGEILAQRLAAELSKKIDIDVPCGTLDITLYRDDFNSPHLFDQTQVRTTEIGFDVDDKLVILVDDVLHTGRSARAALDALIDLGRPQAIKLAVLVDREGREFPIQADFAGYKATVGPTELVRVNFLESDGQDRVYIETE